MLRAYGRDHADQCTAILSVYDKTGLLDLAKGLSKNNVRLLASGGTARTIRDAGFQVEYVSPAASAPAPHPSRA